MRLEVQFRQLYLHVYMHSRGYICVHLKFVKVDNANLGALGSIGILFCCSIGPHRKDGILALTKQCKFIYIFAVC